MDLWISLLNEKRPVKRQKKRSLGCNLEWVGNQGKRLAKRALLVTESRAEQRIELVKSCQLSHLYLFSPLPSTVVWKGSAK